MSKDQNEKIFKVLKCYHDLFNISDELKNRIPGEHHEVIHDQITEIENIAHLLSELEKEVYYQYFTQCLSELEEEEKK